MSLDGQSIGEGVIQFLPVEGTVGPEAGGVISNGQYDIPKQRGPVVGKNRVELRASKKTGRKIQDPTGRPGVQTDEYAELFPPEFQHEQSLVREIKEEPNKLDFDIPTKNQYNKRAATFISRPLHFEAAMKSTFPSRLRTPVRVRSVSPWSSC